MIVCQEGLGASARPQWSGNLSEKEIECESKGPNPGTTRELRHFRAFSPFRLIWLQIRFTQDRQP